MVVGALAWACGDKWTTIERTAATPLPVDDDTPLVPAERGTAPPEGFTVIAESAELEGAYRQGSNASMALDEWGDPLIAYVTEDPAGDGDRRDSTLYFLRWDRLDGRFTNPVVLETVGAINSANPQRQVAVAYDETTGVIGVAYAVGLREVWLAHSKDGGITWVSENITRPNPNGNRVGNPVLALRDDRIFVAYWHEGKRTPEHGTVFFMEREGYVGGFTVRETPLLPGTNANLRGNMALALDADDRPALAYYLLAEAQDEPESRNLTLAFWRPGDNEAVKVTDSNNVLNPIPSLSLAFDQLAPRLVFHLNRQVYSAWESDLYFAASDSGNTWGEPLLLPTDGRDGTFWYQSLALDSQGGVVIAANLHSSWADADCGAPKLLRSADLVRWDVCGVDAEGRNGFAGRYVQAAFDHGDTLQLVFQYYEQDGSEWPSGLIYWREGP